MPNDVTIVFVDNVIYQAMSEIRYRFFKRPEEYKNSELYQSIFR